MQNTPYDDVFRTLLNDCRHLILPVLNEVFGESYRGDEEIIFSPNEHFLNRQDGEESERITDTSFKVLGTKEKKYHWECQSRPDSSMLVRLFEYDAQIALDQGEITGDTLIVTFPHSAVLFLRSNEATPDEMTVEIRTPGTKASYRVPVMKSQNYTTDEIFEKKLLFLLPFHIFSFEKDFEACEKDPARLEILKREYAGITARLEKLLEQGEVNEYTKCTINDMSGKVLENIAQKYGNVKEGVKSVMGGRILDYEAKRIKKEGREEGRKEGRKEGRMEGLQEGKKEGLQEGKKEGQIETLVGLVKDNILSVQEAASRASLPEAGFREQMRKYGG